MNRLLGSTTLTATAIALTACAGGDPESLEQRGSYAVGVQIAGNVQQMQEVLDFDALVQGLRDGLDGEPRMDRPEIAEVMQEFMAMAQEASAERRNELMVSNSEEGEAFLAENSKKDGVVVTLSGLQYEILEDSDGASPLATDRVTVHYEGRLLDGKVFDSSYERGETATFPLNGVIPGWTEGLQLMSVGSKFRFYIPSELGYGENGAGGDIGPNATLIFDVELLEIQ